MLYKFSYIRWWLIITSFAYHDIGLWWQMYNIIFQIVISAAHVVWPVAHLRTLEAFVVNVNGQGHGRTCFGWWAAEVCPYFATGRIPPSTETQYTVSRMKSLCLQGLKRPQLSTIPSIQNTSEHYVETHERPANAPCSCTASLRGNKQTRRRPCFHR